LLYKRQPRQIWSSPPSRHDNVGARIIGSDSVVSKSSISAGTALRRYSWDTRRLADAVETVSLASECTP